MNSMKHSIQKLCIVALIMPACLGCATGKSDHWKFAWWDVRKVMPWSKNDKPDPEVPARMVSTWTEAVRSRAGESPKRGFGGRFVFFKNDSQDPVRVDGQLVVYAFDETGREPYKTEPSKSYVYPADELPKFESQSALGPSYSIWLPWDQAGGTEHNISLIARFEPKGGPVIVGEQTRHYLSGAPASPIPAEAQQQMALTPTPQAVNQVGYQAPMTPPRAAGERSILAAEDPLDTATILLPRKLSPTPGAALMPSRLNNQAPVITTPTMTPATQFAPSVPQGSAAASVPQFQRQQPKSQSYASQAVYPPTPLTAGRAPGRPLAGELPPPSAGYQSPQFQAQATPGVQ